MLGLGKAEANNELEGIKVTRQMKITGITLSENTSLSCATNEREK